jgi:two-component system osmolarity sensor histidine kinase EnvZ
MAALASARPSVQALPRGWSLVGRLTGGVALIALLAFVSQALVLDFWLRPLLEEMAAGMAAHARSLQIALQAVPAAERPALARRLSTPHVGVFEQPPDGDDDEAAPEDLAAQLVARLGPQALVRHGARPAPQAGPMKGVAVGLPVDGRPWWISFSAVPPRSALTATVLFWGAALMALTLAALLLSLRYIARPIGRLAQQIGSQRGPLKTISEAPYTSVELRALVRAFNGLVQAVEAGQATRQQLLAGVSHDLRTPLARLRLRAETQCEPAVGEALTVDLQSLERIVDQFLAFVQGDQDQQHRQGHRTGRLAPLAITVAAVVRRYADEGRPVQAQLAAIEQDTADLPLQRLLGNLIDNALAYGQPPVCVVLAAAPEGGAVLQVLDQGLGMSQAEFELAQQPFVRLSAARSDLGHCGLGLAIVAQIARQGGGELRLARVSGSGGTFGIEVTLPA